MFKILDRYIGKTIIGTSFLTLVMLVGLSAIIKFVDQLPRVGRGSFDILQALFYVVMSIPRDIEMFFPMAALLGALIGLGTLASSSELTVMQAAGFSKLDIGLSVLKTAMPLMIIVVLLGEWGAPQAQKIARETRSYATYGGELAAVRLGVTRSAVWAKDANDFVYIGRVDGDKLQVVNVWKFNDDKTLDQTIFARSASYVGENVWRLNDVHITSHENEVEIGEEVHDEYPWQTTLAPDKLAMVSDRPEELAISGLYNYINYLKDSEQDASRFELAFWRKLLQPLSIAVMMLMALSFVFGPLRSVTMGARVLSGVIAGFAFYISAEFFGPISLVYQIPPFWGAIAPSIAFLGIAIMLLRRNL